MIRTLGKLAVLAAIAEAVRRYAMNNPDKVSQIADQAGSVVDQATKGKYSNQIGGAVRKVQDVTARNSQ
ncbi:MAG TPA: antitoxin [Pseudonocardiaceae bacterium]